MQGHLESSIWPLTSRATLTRTFVQKQRWLTHCEYPSSLRLQRTGGHPKTPSAAGTSQGTSGTGARRQIWVAKPPQLAKGLPKANPLTPPNNITLEGPSHSTLPTRKLSTPASPIALEFLHVTTRKHHRTLADTTSPNPNSLEADPVESPRPPKRLYKPVTLLAGSDEETSVSPP